MRFVRRSIALDRLSVFVGTVVLSALLVALALTYYGFSVGNPWITVGLGSLAAISERGRVRIGKSIEVSISLLPTLFAAVLFGPMAALIVYAMSVLGELRRDSLKWLVYTCSRAITGGLTGLVALGAGDLAKSNIGSIALASTSAVLVAEAIDISFASIAFKVRGHGRILEAMRGYAPTVLASVPFYAPVVAALVLAYDQVSSWTLGLFFVPALAAQRVFILYQDQRQLAEELAFANVRLERANISFATALVTTLDARDRYTAGHSAAVAIYSRDIAERMGLTAEQQRLAHLCGLVHDIGKIGLHPGLLEKPGSLTLSERRQMEEHSAIGERILSKVEDYAEIARIVRHHHERIDGEGYPDQVAGHDIPLLSRIIAVADAYNAMTSDRPYRDAMPSRVARLRLAQAVETQFDTSVVAAFEAILAGAPETYRMASRSDFKLETQDKVSQALEIAVA